MNDSAATKIKPHFYNFCKDDNLLGINRLVGLLENRVTR